MFGLSFSEILVLTVLLIPLIFWGVGFVWLIVYMIYELIKDRLFKDFHFNHRKAQ